jgi:hypothetical protein
MILLADKQVSQWEAMMMRIVRRYNTLLGMKYNLQVFDQKVLDTSRRSYELGLVAPLSACVPVSPSDINNIVLYHHKELKRMAPSIKNEKD